MQVEKSPKPVASCAMPAAPNMNIKTDTDLVKKAREGVMEFLLVRFVNCSSMPSAHGFFAIRSMAAIIQCTLTFINYPWMKRG